MRFNAETTVARIVNMLANSKALLARYIRRLVEARRRRIEHEREFYRNLRSYCLANKLSPVCADDWKTAVEYNGDDDLSIARR